MSTYPLDLLLTQRRANHLTTDRTVVDLMANQRDLATVTGQDHLVQALLNRLSTRQGELAALGHPNYGSRLYLLVGEPDNTRTRALAELYIRECLSQDTRISEVIDVVFAALRRDRNRNTLTATITVLPTDDPAPLSIPLTLL